jgi:hypothetical protein
MRFEVSYRSGTSHEVEIPGDVAVIGRDPGCDVVINDTKCSRRHAVAEDGPDGLAIRDSGSANGVYVNNQRVERALLKPGDTIRLGDTRLTVLPDVGATVVVATEELDLSLEEVPGGAGSPPVERRKPEPRRVPDAPPRATAAPERRPPARPVRPLTVTVLSALWTLSVPVSLGLPIVLALRLGAGVGAWVLLGGVGLVLGALCVVLALGLHALRPWARLLQIATAAVGLLVCPLTLASTTVLFYMARPEVKAAFEKRPSGASSSGAELTFALSLVGMLLLGVAVTGGLWLLLVAGR